MRNFFAGLFVCAAIFVGYDQYQSSAAARPAADAAPAAISTDRLAGIDDHFNALVRNGSIRGATTLVAVDGEIVHFSGHGKRGEDEGVDTGENTIYRIYSMTKPVTGVAMMMLWEEGKYHLDDPVSKYLPEFESQRVYQSGETSSDMVTRPVPREMTIRDLMTHSAGLTYGVFGNHPVDQAYREAGLLGPDADLPELTRRLAALPLMYEPGERYHYSVSVDVQGRLVEVLSGMKFSEFLQNRLFDPLGMKDTGFWVPEDKQDRLVDMYMRDEGGTLAVVTEEGFHFLEKPPLFESGGAGLVSTAMDYWRFGQMLANEGFFQGKRYLKAETVQLMTRNHLPATSPWLMQGTQPVYGRGMGLNFGVVVDPSRDSGNFQIGEFSWTGAASTAFWVDPANKMVVLFLTNIMPYEATAHVNSLHDILYGQH